MELLPVVLTSGWASGINAYLVVLVLGLIGRFGDVAAVPEGLTRTDVLVVAAVMYLVELVADKIPYVDSTWDVISTAIRPTVGAVIGVLLAGDADTLDQAVSGTVGGGTALTSRGPIEPPLQPAAKATHTPGVSVSASLAASSAVFRGSSSGSRTQASAKASICWSVSDSASGT